MEDSRRRLEGARPDGGVGGQLEAVVLLDALVVPREHPQALVVLRPVLEADTVGGLPLLQAGAVEGVGRSAQEAGYTATLGTTP